MKKLYTIVLLVIACIAMPPQAHAQNNMGLILRGFAKTLGAAFAVPATMISDSTQSVFPFGIISGALRGSVKTVAGTLGGAFDMARGAAPYAKYAALAL